MGIDGLNNFGSLTTQNGKRLTFKDFDLNRDGQISEEEFNTVLKANPEIIDNLNPNTCIIDNSKSNSKQNITLIIDKIESC